MRSAEQARLLAAIGSVLGLGGPYEEAPLPDVSADLPGRTVLAGTTDESDGVIARVAWVEDVSVPRYGAGRADEIRLHVAGRTLGQQDMRLYHYNPYFGTRVLLIRFYGDTLVVVYHEKHNSYAVRVTPPSTEIYSVNVGKDPEIHGDLVAWAPYHEDLLHHVRLPGLAPMVPLPLPPQRGRSAALEIDDGPTGTFVRWADSLDASVPGVVPIESQDPRTCRLRLPTGVQGELATGSGAVRQVWQGLRKRLEGSNAPPDGPDVLIATAAAPFWCQDIGESRGPSSATSSWWFAAAYWSYLTADPGSGGAGRPDEAERWLVWLEQLATPTLGPYTGWDPTWDSIDGAVQLGTVHLRRRAGQIAAACRAGNLPTNLPTRANEKGEWKPARASIDDLPEGFLRAWDQIPGDFPYPHLNLSKHYN
jgi:hypothetical protein